MTHLDRIRAVKDQARNQLLAIPGVHCNRRLARRRSAARRPPSWRLSYSSLVERNPPASCRRGDNPCADRRRADGRRRGGVASVRAHDNGKLRCARRRYSDTQAGTSVHRARHARLYRQDRRSAAQVRRPNLPPRRRSVVGDLSSTEESYTKSRPAPGHPVRRKRRRGPGALQRQRSPRARRRRHATFQGRLTT